MFGGAVSSAIDHVVTPFFTTETFEGSPAPEKESGKAALVSFLTLIVILLLLLLVGKYLWNTVLVSLMPFIKPAKSIWQILGLSILLGLISPGCSVIA
jgi:hypothetical protein|uniref:Uncharacterized protein n=1 Tax=viral metagenome TaxID=1070528 RepID=A0A6C0KVQ7_9ZZZZ